MALAQTVTMTGMSYLITNGLAPLTQLSVFAQSRSLNLKHHFVFLLDEMKGEVFDLSLCKEERVMPV